MAAKRLAEFDVKASPRLIVDQPPAMAAAGRIRSQQHVSGMQDEGLAVTRGEFERARKRNDVLNVRCGMPV